MGVFPVTIHLANINVIIHPGIHEGRQALVVTHRGRRMAVRRAGVPRSGGVTGNRVTGVTASTPATHHSLGALVIRPRVAAELEHVRREFAGAADY